MLSKKKAHKKNKSFNILEIFVKYFKLVLVLVIVIFMVVAYLLLAPFYTEYQLLSGQLINEKRVNLSNYRDMFVEAIQVNKTYADISPYLKDKLADFLPNQPNLPDLYYNLEQLANQAGYKLLSVNVNMPAEKKKVPRGAGFEAKNKTQILKEISIDVELGGGGYLALKKFVALVENNLRMLDVQSFSYDPESESISIYLKTYFYSIDEGD